MSIFFGAGDYYGPGSPEYDYSSQATRNSDTVGASYVDIAEGNGSGTFYAPPPVPPPAAEPSKVLLYVGFGLGAVGLYLALS